MCLLCLGLFDLGFFDGLLQLVFIDGFQNEISDLIADGFYRIVEISMAGEDGNGDIRKPFPDMLDQGEAVHNGHTDIRQDQIRREIFQKFQGLGAVGSGGDIRWKRKRQIFLDHHANAVQNNSLIIYDQNTKHFNSFLPQNDFLW